MPETITIVGGGLAGLTLGIGLRQRGVAVTLWEAGRYPRHRVCGEFISGRGQSSLARLRLLGLVQSAGARDATSAGFFAGKAFFSAGALHGMDGPIAEPVAGVIATEIAGALGTCRILQAGQQPVAQRPPG